MNHEMVRSDELEGREVAEMGNVIRTIMYNPEDIFESVKVIVILRVVLVLVIEVIVRLTFET